jgi:predicted O-linked N-acetylglucosamine transferase (SPINDLY family)
MEIKNGYEASNLEELQELYGCDAINEEEFDYYSDLLNAALKDKESLTSQLEIDASIKSRFKNKVQYKKLYFEALEQIKKYQAELAESQKKYNNLEKEFEKREKYHWFQLEG